MSTGKPMLKKVKELGGTPEPQTEGNSRQSPVGDQYSAHIATPPELEQALRELERLRSERDELSRRVVELTQALESLRFEVEREALVAEGQRRRNDVAFNQSRPAPEAGRDVEHLRRLLQRTAIAVCSFQTRMEEQLKTYRSQRAWKVMLFFRKVYSLALRQGWAGRLRLARDLLHLGAGRGQSLKEFELSFPDILNYVPEELFARTVASKSENCEAGLCVSRAGRPQAGPDVIILPVFDFEFRMQRPQHMALGLARRGCRVFWVSPSRFASPSSDKSYELAEIGENLWEVRLRSGHFDLYREMPPDYLIDEQLAALRELYRDCAIAASCVMVQLPCWRRLALSLRKQFGACVLYDCMDDWEAMPGIGDELKREGDSLAREADCLVASSRRLSDKMGRRGLQPVLIRNGADFAFFSSASPRGLLANISKPVVGYFGALAEWFDFKLVAEVAKLRPGYSFVLIGGAGLEADVQNKEISLLRKLPNVHLLGHKPYVLMPSYLAEFDACMVPFVLNEVTHATDPVKLYEYFSQGKPVVATAMSELAGLDGMVYLASDARDFAARLDAALGEQDPEIKQRRIDYAGESSWAGRARAMEDAMRNAFPQVSVVIVTHNSAAYVAPCLDSLRRNTAYPRWELIVVDNASGDGTAELVEEAARKDSRIRLIRLEENLGFAAANNIGLRAAQGDYMILLNADTVVTPGWMGRLMLHARRDPAVGMVVPVTNCAGNEACIDVRYADQEDMEEFALKLAREKMGVRRDVAVGPLFCALIPRPAWERAGELDERFEVGMFEDDDYSRRILEAGFKIIIAEDCFVHHFGQGSFSKLSAERYQEIFERNRRRFEQKWGIAWTQHSYREGVSGRNRRYTPESFAGQSEP